MLKIASILCSLILFVPVTVQALTLEQKIGQMMIIGFEKPYMDAHISNMITRYHIGGVNILKRNVGTTEEVKKLFVDIQKRNSTFNDVPLLIAVDQEGGDVVRFKFLKEKTPERYITSISDAYDRALERGKELASLGVNMNFAPVVDYVNDPKSYLYSRTFATTTLMTVPLAKAMMHGYRDAGILGVYKHFPGYGNILPDPHKNAALIADPTFLKQSLNPFKRLLTDNSRDPVMTAHIIYSSLVPVPATFSRFFLTEILRRQWNYQGVIITDDLEMASVGKQSLESLAIKSIKAGADMIISTYDTTKHEKIILAITDAVRRGEISQKRIDESVARIFAMKGQLK